MADSLPSLGPKYRLERRLAQVGMAEVFLARHEGPAGFSRRVLVKTLLPELAREPPQVKQFLSAARIAAQLTHPNIVHLYDFGEHEGTYYVVLEHLEGESVASLLRAALKAGRQLTPGFVASVGAHVCSGLSYANSCCDPEGRPSGLVHRDLNPLNIVACADGTVKILDFGFARPEGVSAYTEAGQVRNQPRYCSPELGSARPVDARSDLFSLGVVLWELVARRTLVGGDSPAEMARFVREVSAPRLRTVDPSCPEELAAIVERALQLDPALRFASASEMGRALESFLSRIGANPAEEIRTELLRAQIVGGAAANAHPEAERAPDWLTRDLDPSASPAASPSGLELEAPRPAAPAPVSALGPAAPSSQPRPAHEPKRLRPANPIRSRVVFAAAVGALALVAAGYWLFFGSSGAAPAAPAELRVRSDPPGATVRLGDVTLGSTPYAGTNVVPPGEHVLRIELPGHAPETRLVRGGESMWLFAEMLPLHMHTRQLSTTESAAPPRPARRGDGGEAGTLTPAQERDVQKAMRESEKQRP